MIARLKGKIEDKSADSVVVMSGGVGYQVFIPLSTFYDLPEEGAEVCLWVRTVVRDDSIDLFGFLTPQEREAFLILNSVSKIGPRLALNILSGISPAELVRAVGAKDVARLSSVPGVGAKTAERLILELKDKAARLAAALPGVEPGAEAIPMDEVGRDVISALMNLGYRKAEAQRAYAAAQAEAGSSDLAGLLRSSLSKLRKA